MRPTREFLLLLSDITSRLQYGESLQAIARRCGRSPFQLHREFQRVSGETLKQFTLRLRLERAAAELLARGGDVLSIALAYGFRSHEVFTRAFRRRFGCSPMQYRRAARLVSPAQRLRNLRLVKSIGPCVRFFHRPLYKHFGPKEHNPMPTLSITRKEIAPQPILYIRRRIAPSEMQQALGECFGKLFAHGMKMALPMAGQPLCRYVSTGQGLWTIDPAMPLATAVAGEGEMQADFLPGGPVACGIHSGPYDQLPDTNAAIERWIEVNGYQVGGAPWEQYVTDPAEYPDPKDWRTEVYWPLAK